MTDPNPHAGSTRFRRPGAGLLMLVAALGVYFVVMVALTSPAQAETIKVTNTNNLGPGSLRRAISEAAPRGDTITFASNVLGTITLTSETLYVNKNLTIKGPGATKLALSGNNRRTAFYIEYGKTVRISGLAITKGSTYDASDYSGGGIYNEGNLTLANSVVRGNYAEDSGGGIYNGNVLRLTQTTVRGNSVDYDGGGIENDGGTLIVDRSTISGNTAGEYGGGLYSDTDNPTRTVIINSTISGNSVASADSAGGGVYNFNGLTEIDNTTITNNTAPDGQGGGVFSYDDDYTTTRVFSTIIADNDGGFGPIYSFVSKGYNIIGSGAPSVANRFNKTGDQVAVSNPGLGSFADNGGSTWTYALLNGSPAINRGSPTCPPPPRTSAVCGGPREAAVT